jgi:hypothetical protein
MAIFLLLCSVLSERWLPSNSTILASTVLITSLHRPSTKHHFQQYLYCCMRIHCSGSVFTKPLPRSGSTCYTIYTSIPLHLLHLKGMIQLETRCWAQGNITVIATVYCFSFFSVQITHLLACFLVPVGRFTSGKASLWIFQQGLSVMSWLLWVGPSELLLHTSEMISVLCLFITANKCTCHHVFSISHINWTL